ncbi:hypothetical protein SMSP2_01804 [Limihaloglobus sulfuriphilus]|uniref:Uncharacterized protein n=1 Tax=Limihaloglobus sulfuriphilus TaxID=1851148 RepID=A0A1Q2MFI6_9BACT|nr:hypothetical protein SMSP2_01804 [Limihaloglobus sulfuriphilus]
MLTPDDYQIQMRDIAKSYDMISQNPALSKTHLGDFARARLDTLDRTVNPTGPNVPLVNSLENLVR